jgi:NitT/TauT family transport system substrate-binding protein
MHLITIEGDVKHKLVFGVVMMLASAATFTGASAQEKLSVRLDFPPWGIHTALHLASEKGWFKDEGLDVTITDGKGSNLTIQQVASGEVDIGQVQVTASAVGRSKGLPVISIAGFIRSGDVGALVAADSNINSVKDLEGKKVAYVASTTAAVVAEPFFKAGGADPKKIDMLNVDASSQMSVYTAKTVDAVMMSVPLGVAVAAKTRPSKGVMLTDVGMNLPSYGLITSEKTLKERAPVLKKFVSVAVRAWEYLYSDPSHIDEGVKAMMAQRSNDKLDPVILKDQVTLYKPLLYTEATKDKKIGWQSEQDWQNAVATMEKVGLLPDGSKTSDFYTNAFVSEK